jgi:F-type H+-transporting ATPase subunit delta
MQKQGSKVARRYAGSLLGFAQKQNELDAVADDMRLIAQTCADSPDLRRALKSPVIKTDKKVAVLNSIFGGHIGTTSQNFIRMVAVNNREAILPEIARAFIALYRERLGIVAAEIITAVPLSDQEREKAKSMVSGMGKSVELSEKIDENIIGGFIIQIGDKQLDQSVSSRLSAIKTSLMQKST